MALAHNAELPHPASLEGLEHLLDRIFEVDYSPPSAESEAATAAFKPLKIASDDKTSRPILSGNKASKTDELEATVILLRSQLSYTRAELKETRSHNRWLELQTVAKDDQLRLLPDLFQRASQVTIVERELLDSQQQTAQAIADCHAVKEQLNAMRDTLWWRIGTMLGIVT